MKTESGNALWIVLLSIVLLTALTLAVTRSSDRTEQTGSVERSRISASEIMRWTKGLEQAVTQMRLRGLPENDVSFEVSFLSGYSNGNCTGSDCLVFDRAGGGQAYKQPGNINDGTDWIITGGNAVSGVGTAAADLIIILPNVSEDTCKQINRLTGAPAAPADASVDFTPYTGSFDASPDDIDTVSGAKAACVDNSGGTYDRFYYQVLITR